jgi:methyltransferase
VQVLLMPEHAWAYLFIGVLGIERLIELLIARRNERWMLSRGAREYGHSFSKVLFTFHGLWFFSFILEASLSQRSPLIGPVWIMGMLLLMQSLRYWCILSLGYHWNTKIIVLPRAEIVRKGPYRWLRHPNYWVVRIEMALYPLLFGCFFTAIVFGAANLWILKKRIAEEEKALQSLRQQMQS